MAAGQLRDRRAVLPLAVAAAADTAADAGRRAGRLYVGTSGFAYPAWSPLFYPSGTRGEGLLAAYSGRLPAVELNNTYYQHPKPERIGAWLAQTPDSFRFAVKALRSGSLRAFATDPAATLPWLTEPYRSFGERLGAVLFRVPAPIRRDDARLARFLALWPPELPLALELQHPSWLDDTVLDWLRAARAVLCTSELEGDASAPPLFLTGPFLYLRLRRERYTPGELRAWAERLAPFLDDGRDVHVYFRHDENGESALRALELASLLQAG